MAKVRLGDIATVVTKGTTPTTMGFQFEDSGINFVKIESISEDGSFLKEKFSHISSECNAQMRRSQLQENDILFSIAGAIGRSAIVTKEILPANTNQALAIIRVPKGKIDYNYLLYALSSSAINQQATQHQQGVAQLNISLKNVSDFLLPIYTEAMQKRIVHNLKKIDKLIFLRKQQLSKLDELVKARFVEMFGDPVSNPMGWKRVRFDSISENLDSKRVPVTESDRKDGVYPYYGASGIVDWINDYIFDEDILLVSEDGANLLMRSTPIAFSVSGKSWVNNHAHVVRFHDFATQKFIEVYFSLIDISEYITGTAQPKLNQAKLNAMLFCWPPLSLQNQFAAFVERVNQQKQTVQQSLEKLELMKKALMQEYFG